MSILTTVFPLRDTELRRLLAVHAPAPPQWFRPQGLPAAPEKSSRLVELEKEVNGARESDIKVAVERLAEGRTGVLLREDESLTGMVLPTIRAELEELRKAYDAEYAEWSRTAWELTYAQWPWFYADLVLGAERATRG